ncbi:MAG: nucleotidyltransferase domain-containing protein [Cyclobacteriaceae bacterium]
MGYLESFRNELHELCANHNVKSLYSFGSVNTTNFSDESDIDFLVEFSTNDPIEYTEHYFDLKFGLESMFKRPIDLLESKALKNPYLKDNIDKSKVLVYG